MMLEAYEHHAYGIMDDIDDDEDKEDDVFRTSGKQTLP